jgi:hypothetical protein
LGKPDGAPHTKPVTPVVGGWVRGPKQKRVRFIPLIFFVVFLNPPHRETPENAKKNWGFFVDFFVKTFRHDLFVKRFWWCF